MRKITLRDVEQKADFVSRYLDYAVTVEVYNQGYFVNYDYGLEGRDTMAGPTLPDCNNHLNYLIRKMALKDEWIEEKNK